MARIIAATSAESLAVKYLPPVLDGLEAWHFLNDSNTKAARNFAPGKPDGQVIGTPVASATHVALRGLQNYVQTQFEEPLEGTYFVVARTAASLANDANRPMYFGTFQSPAAGGGGNTFGVSVAWNATQPGVFAGRGTSPSDHQSAPRFIDVAAPNTFALLTVLTPNTSPSRIRNETAGTEAASSVSTQRLRSTGRFRIGSGMQSFGGVCDIALFAGYSRILSTNEIAATVTNIRQYLAGRGVTV